MGGGGYSEHGGRGLQWMERITGKRVTGKGGVICNIRNTSKAQRAAVSMMAKGCMSTVSEVFLIFTIKLYQFLVFIFHLHYLVTWMKYSFLNTPKQQYFMLLTSGG